MMLKLLVVYILIIYVTCIPLKLINNDKHIHNNNNLPNYCGNSNIPVIPSLDNNNVKLIQSQLIIRHGDRYYANNPEPNGICWPNDHVTWNCNASHDSIPDIHPLNTSINTNRLYRKRYLSHDGTTNCGIGQLTEHGSLQQVLHGQMIRDLYINKLKLLSNYLNRSEIYIRSDDVPRTILSAESLINGLYPSSSSNKNNDNDISLVDIDVFPLTYSVMYPNPNLCPNLSTLSNKAQHSSAYLEYVQTHAVPLLKQLSTALKMNVTMDNVGQIFDCALVHICHHKEVPNILSPSSNVFQEFVNAYTYLTAFVYKYPDFITMGKLSMGPLIKEIAELFKSRKYKFVLHSGHDSTVMPLLAAFDVFNGEWSPYASLIAIELYESTNNSNQMYIRFVYNGKVLHPHGCPTNNDLCEWETFEKLLNQLIPTEKDCPNLNK